MLNHGRNIEKKKLWKQTRIYKSKVTLFDNFGRQAPTLSWVYIPKLTKGVSLTIIKFWEEFKELKAQNYPEGMSERETGGQTEFLQKF